MEWINAETKPEAGRAVIVTYTSDTGRQQWARACWVPKYTEEDTGNYLGDASYNEENDTYYWPEGWYEWNQHEETHWQMDGEITHWAKVDLPFNAAMSGAEPASSAERPLDGTVMQED
jgi:hypothetical protein